MPTVTHNTCPHAGCDATIRSAANFCPRCGRSLVPVRKHGTRRRGGGIDLMWFGLTVVSLMVGVALMRRGICFGFVFIGLPIASIFYGRNKAESM